MAVVKIKVNGEWVEVPALKGDPGAAGNDGNTYTITAADYDAIAAVVYNDYLTDATNVGY